MWSRLLQQRPRLVKAGRAVVTVTQWLCIWHVVTENIGGPRVTAGPSMLPTLNNTMDVVLEECLSRRFSPPRITRGDIVTLQSPVEPGRMVCKRVIGLAGDTICVDPTREQGWAAKEARRQDELRRRPWGPDHVVVPTGHIWVAGDNTAASRDSRSYGPIPVALVRGRIIARLYPAPRWFINPIVYID